MYLVHGIPGYGPPPNRLTRAVFNFRRRVHPLFIRPFLSSRMKTWMKVLECVWYIFVIIVFSSFHPWMIHRMILIHPSNMPPKGALGWEVDECGIGTAPTPSPLMLMSLSGFLIKLMTAFFMLSLFE